MEGSFQVHPVGANLYNNSIDLIGNNYITQAEDLLKQAIDMEGRNEKYLNVLGLCKYIKGIFEEAKACWVKSVSIESSHNEAQKYLEEMDNHIFRQYILQFNSCIGYIENARLLKALTTLLPYLEKVPNVHGLNLAGLLSYKLGFTKTAISLWKSSLALDLTEKNTLNYISSCRESAIPLVIEKFILEVFFLVGRLKLL